MDQKGSRSRKSALAKDWKALAVQEVSRFVGTVSSTHKTNYITDFFLGATFLLGGRYYQPIPTSVSAGALLLTLFFIVGCFVYAEWRCRH
jgi:hypothetical protein